MDWHVAHVAKRSFKNLKTYLCSTYFLGSTEFPDYSVSLIESQRLESLYDVDTDMLIDTFADNRA